MEFRAFENDSTYKETYDENFSKVERFSRAKEYKDFVHYLSKTINIDEEVIDLDLKHKIFYNTEYFPDKLKKQKNNSFWFIYLLYRSFTKGKVKQEVKSSIILDNWTKDTIENFYSNDLYENIKDKTSLMCFEDLFFPYFPQVFKNLFKILKLGNLIKRILKLTNIDLRRNLINILESYFVGIYIKNYIAPKLIVSGDDNGLNVIKAKSSGADILLIQNGRRVIMSDSAFQYSDHYFAMGDKLILDIRKEQGCIFKKSYSLGSIRLRNFIENHKLQEYTKKYDILYIGQGECLFKNDWFYQHFMPIELELKTIDEVLDYAVKNDKSIAYQCRDDSEYNFLVEKGYPQRGLAILKRNNSFGSYHAIMKSELILASWSTLSREALALGKKVILINLSDNSYLNYHYSYMNIEYNRNLLKTSLEDFINNLLISPIKKNIVMNQSDRYMDILIDLIKSYI